MRPEGWDATKIIAERIGEVTSFTTLEMLIEAGADAMLEGLLKQEGFQCYVYDNPGTTIVIPKPPMLPNGYLVFIPED